VIVHGASGPPAVRAAGPEAGPGPILFAVQTASAEQADDVRTILRQYGARLGPFTGAIRRPDAP
jgi:hypothetical protein